MEDAGMVVEDQHQPHCALLMALLAFSDTTAKNGKR